MTRQEFWISLWAEKGAKPDCPFCGQDRWIGWDERVSLEKIIPGRDGTEGIQIVPLTCTVCGFIRFQEPNFQRLENAN